MTRHLIVILIGLLLFVAVFGSLFCRQWSYTETIIYHTSHPSTNQSESWGTTVTVDGKPVPVGEYISDNMSPENIRSNLRFLTLKPHIAGKAINSELARSLYTQWKGYGFDRVEMSNYSVLLDYVDRSNYNVLKLQDKNGNTIYTANTTQEKPLVEGEDDPDVPPPFNAYSGVGKATGPLVYVNYAEVDDFDYLKNHIGLHLTDYICIARYGKIYRGNKAKIAQANGCLALLIYSDPQDYAPTNGPLVFPDGPMLPPSGLQRGTLVIDNGDPLTPGLPSIDGIHRRTYEDAVKNNDVPSIPVQPISYGDAIHFMSQLLLFEAPIEWRGGLNLTAYYILQKRENPVMTYIEVNNKKQQATVNNVIGTIYGSIEPEHVIILGNHRDAWTFGGVDPNSGTSVLMEIARILGDMKSKGWRPGRTIMLCSWDGEEYGTMGSTEWVEHYQKLLGASAVAYLNVDVAVEGRDHITASSSPLLFETIFNTAKQVKCPGDQFATLYEQWSYYFPTFSSQNIDNLGAGSDFVSFVQLVGITAADLSYTYERDYIYYSVYHSVHDNFYWSSVFGDPDYTHHKALGELWSRIATSLATTPILPYNPVDYAARLASMLAVLRAKSGDDLKQHNITTETLDSAIHNFTSAAYYLKSVLHNNTNTTNKNIIRFLNSKLMNMERAFIHPEGLPGQKYNRHVIMAPSSINSYAGGSFPGVGDAILMGDWDEVQRQIDILAVHIMYATQIMEQPGIQWL